ncbi:hypothetical protein Tco_0952993 [Tanacetum coccineum]|uniref:Uncharacterized protein n=1 Tax=Tanacetum coccineum TaxID=301880 RepID=A0ABQ5E1F5_9ASTR
MSFVDDVPRELQRMASESTSYMWLQLLQFPEYIVVFVGLSLASAKKDDDDDLLLKVCISPSFESWLRSHTKSVFATMKGAWHRYRIRKPEPHLLLLHPKSCLKQRLCFLRAYFIDIRNLARQLYAYCGCSHCAMMIFYCCVFMSHGLQTPVFWQGSHSYTVVVAIDSVLCGSYISGSEP